MQPVENTTRVSALQKRETLLRREEPPEVHLSGFFGGGREKSERGRKKESASSKALRREARGVRKLKRARAPLSSEEE
jgi:hypothetical protein